MFNSENCINFEQIKDEGKIKWMPVNLKKFF